jgi:hypothetical protein
MAWLGDRASLLSNELANQRMHPTAATADAERPRVMRDR